MQVLLLVACCHQSAPAEIVEGRVEQFIYLFIYLADILSAFCIPMGCEGTF